MRNWRKDNANSKTRVKKFHNIFELSRVYICAIFAYYRYISVSKFEFCINNAPQTFTTEKSDFFLVLCRNDGFEDGIQGIYMYNIHIHILFFL